MKRERFITDAAHASGVLSEICAIEQTVRWKPHVCYVMKRSAQTSDEPSR